MIGLYGDDVPKTAEVSDRSSSSRRSRQASLNISVQPAGQSAAVQFESWWLHPIGSEQQPANTSAHFPALRGLCVNDG